MDAARTRRLSPLFVLLATVSCAALTGAQATFASPDQAANALVAALESDDYSLFLSVAGHQMAGFWNTGDPERDALDRRRFVGAARGMGIRKDPGQGERRLFYMGSIEQSFPAPLVKTDSGWRFDDDAGSKELLTRRIRRNEIAA